MVLAKIISFIFHPLFMATYLFCVFAFFFPVGFEPLNESSVWRFILIIAFSTFLIPALLIGLFRSMGAISEVTMQTRSERILPFVLITAIYVGVTYSFYSLNRVNGNDNFLKFLMIIDALVVVSTIATFFFKVSVHSVAAWGFIGILFSLNLVSDNGALYYPSLLAILVAGVIMSARLYLNVHTLREVLAGAILGLATSMIGMHYLFQY